MRATSRSNRLLGGLLAGMALALAGLAAYEWQAGQGLKERLERQVFRSVARAEPTQMLPPFALQTMNAYSGIVQHPLFTPNRQPPPAAGASAAPPRKFVLTGIADSGRTAVVLLKDVQTGETERLRLGMPGTGGVELESVEGNTAVLKQGNAHIQLDLQVLSSAAAAALVSPRGQPKQPTGAVGGAPPTSGGTPSNAAAGARPAVDAEPHPPSDVQRTGLGPPLQLH